jgi:cytochrome bd-type quinol oxidase subunit 2
MIRRPSAFAPIAMSLAALGIVVVQILIAGTARQADEGTAAHLWQLLMAAQIPIIGFFAIRWLPQSPRSAAPVLTLQAVAALAALAPVYLLNW